LLSKMTKLTGKLNKYLEEDQAEMGQTLGEVTGAIDEQSTTLSSAPAPAKLTANGGYRFRSRRGRSAQQEYTPGCTLNMYADKDFKGSAFKVSTTEVTGETFLKEDVMDGVSSVKSTGCSYVELFDNDYGGCKRNFDDNIKIDGDANEKKLAWDLDNDICGVFISARPPFEKIESILGTYQSNRAKPETVSFGFNSAGKIEINKDATKKVAGGLNSNAMTVKEFTEGGKLHYKPYDMTGIFDGKKTPNTIVWENTNGDPTGVIYTKTAEYVYAETPAAAAGPAVDDVTTFQAKQLEESICTNAGALVKQIIGAKGRAAKVGVFMQQVSLIMEATNEVKVTLTGRLTEFETDISVMEVKQADLEISMVTTAAKIEVLETTLKTIKDTIATDKDAIVTADGITAKANEDTEAANDQTKINKDETDQAKADADANDEKAAKDKQDSADLDDKTDKLNDSTDALNDEADASDKATIEANEATEKAKTDEENAKEAIKLADEEIAANKKSIEDLKSSEEKITSTLKSATSKFAQIKRNFASQQRRFGPHIQVFNFCNEMKCYDLCRVAKEGGSILGSCEAQIAVDKFFDSNPNECGDDCGKEEGDIKICSSIACGSTMVNLPAQMKLVHKREKTLCTAASQTLLKRRNKSGAWQAPF